MDNSDTIVDLLLYYIGSNNIILTVDKKKDTVRAIITLLTILVLPKYDLG